MQMIASKMDENISLLEEERNNTKESHLINDFDQSFSKNRHEMSHLQGEISGISEIETKNKSKNKSKSIKNLNMIKSKASSSNKLITQLYTEEKAGYSKNDFGDRLYSNYMKKTKKKKEHNEKIRNLKLEMEMKETTFTPNINEKSRELSNIHEENERNDHIKQSVEQRLIKYGNNKKNKLEKLVVINQMKDYDYSYSPILDEKTKRLADKSKKRRQENMINAGYIFDNKYYDTEKHETDTSHITNPKTIKQENYSDSIDEFTYIKKRSNQKKTKFNTNKSKSKSKKSVIKSDKFNTDYSNTEISLLKPPVYKEYLTTMRNNYRSKNNNRHNFPRQSNTPHSISRISSKNKKSTSLVSKDKKINNINDELYYNYDLILKKEMEEMKKYRDDVYPFKPKINKTNINVYNQKETKDEFINRLVNSKLVSDEKYNHKERVSKTNEYTFKPSITKYKSKSPDIEDRRYVNPNFNDFYGERLVKNIKEIENKESKLKNEQNETWIRECKKKIAKIRINKAKELFDKLDSDGDGLVSINKMNVSYIDEVLIDKIITSFSNMKNKNEELNFKQFYYTVFENMDESIDKDKDN